MYGFIKLYIVVATAMRRGCLLSSKNTDVFGVKFI